LGDYTGVCIAKPTDLIYLTLGRDRSCSASPFRSTKACGQIVSHSFSLHHLIDVTNSAANDFWGKTYLSLSGETKMSQQLSILTGCSAGATESFVVVPFELVKIKYV